MTGRDLRERQAARLALAAEPRAVHERGALLDDRGDQCRNEFRTVAAVAVEKQQDLGVRARGGNAGLQGASIAALRFDHDARACGLRALDGAIARATVAERVVLVAALRERRD